MTHKANLAQSDSWLNIADLIVRIVRDTERLVVKRRELGKRKRRLAHPGNTGALS